MVVKDNKAKERKYNAFINSTFKKFKLLQKQVKSKRKIKHSRNLIAKLCHPGIETHKHFGEQ